MTQEFQKAMRLVTETLRELPGIEGIVLEGSCAENLEASFSDLNMGNISPKPLPFWKGRCRRLHNSATTPPGGKISKKP